MPCQELNEPLKAQAQRSELLETCRMRCAEMGAFIRKWLSLAKGEEKTEDVLWVETFGLSLQLHLTPLSIAEVFNKQREGHATRVDFHLGDAGDQAGFYVFRFPYGALGSRIENMAKPVQLRRACPFIRSPDNAIAAIA